MKFPPLDILKIREAIKDIEQANIDHNTVDDYFNLLNPLFAGYATIAVELPPGIYVHRIRICKKPSNISEVSFPPSSHAAIGRANDTGEAMFYASVGKNVPFFELDPQINDHLAVTTWKTTKNMMINHVGYTNAVGSRLNSERVFEDVHSFRVEMKKQGEANELVYQTLADWFSRDVQQNEKSKYKLSIAIARHMLSGDTFDGLLYPTVKMFGNADNLVLNPEFVIDSMELVSIEYFVVISKKGLDIQYETLDTSTRWTEEGEIEWSGRLLGRIISPFSKQKLSSEAGEWIAKDEEDVRIDLCPTTLIDINPSEALAKYLKCYLFTFKSSHDLIVESQHKKVSIRVNLHLDLRAREKFLSFYIPKTHLAAALVASLIDRYDLYIDVNKEVKIRMENPKNPSEFWTSDDVRDIGFIHFYLEDYVDYDRIQRANNSNILVKIESPPALPSTIHFTLR